MAEIVFFRFVDCCIQQDGGFCSGISVESVHISFLLTVHGEVYSIQHYVIKFVSDWLATGRCFSPGTDHHESGVKHYKPT